MPGTREPGPQEIELKLGLKEGAREALEKCPLFAGTPADERHELTTSWDTPGFDLAARGVSLRVRRRGESRRQTVKLLGRRSLVTTRGEWEWDVASDTPDLSLLRAVPDVSLPDTSSLVPVFQTDIQRSARTVTVGGATIEIAIDIGAVRAGEASLPVAEAELELKSGDPAALHHLARALCAAAPLAIVVDGKADRGYRLAAGKPPAWHKDRRPPLSHRISARAALREVIDEAVGHFLANVPAALADDAEGVHQARAAIRRLRAALRLFGGHDPEVDRLRDELKGVGKVLGEARDWDVFAAEIMPASYDGETPPIAGPAAIWRAGAHQAARALLQDSKLLALLLDVLIWADHADPPGLARQHLAARLDREARRARKRGRHVATRTTGELHALRRAVRRLRYEAEFMAGVFGPKAAKPYIKRCKQLQTELGHLGDAALAERLVQRLPPGPDDDVGRVLARGARVRADTASRVPHLWRRLRAATPFWR
jgi:triphosphatase